MNIDKYTMNSNIIVDKRDELQEEIYWFPYHHVVQYAPHFIQCFNDGWGINYASTLEFLLKRLESKQHAARVIDFGCGDGRLTKEIRARFPRFRVDGVDYSKRAIRFARAFDPQGHFQVKNLIGAKPENIKYDVGLCIEVFEHIAPEAADSFLQYIYESMSDNGVLHMTVPHVNDPLHDRHYRHFNSTSVQRELSRYFSITDLVFIEKRSWKRTWINFILQNKFFIMNHRRILNRIYTYYKHNLFITEERHCNRIYICAVKK